MSRRSPLVAPPGSPRAARRSHLAAALAAAACAVAACATGTQPAVLDALTAHARTTTELRALARRMELPPGAAARVLELARDADTSQHLVAVRDREELHRHDRHAITVVLLAGRGRMHIAGEERAVGEGSIVHVPRGVVHAFINESPEPAVAFVVYAPPYDGNDRVPATERASAR